MSGDGLPTSPGRLRRGAGRAWLAFACLGWATLTGAAETQVLDDGVLRVEVAPALGGRIVHASLHGRGNLLKAGDAAIAAQPSPVPSADGDNIPYLGHELWIGPQARWWLDQDVNPQRRDSAAPWPPDPWLANARNRVLESSPSHIVLEGVPSPVSGLQVRQALRLVEGAPGTLQLDAEAVNTRDREVHRNLWFNTRVPATSRVFVPVASPGDARLRADGSEVYDGPVAWWRDGLYSLQLDPPPPGKGGRRGKVFVAPSAGWIAAFVADQLLLIRFDLQPGDGIDPGHGQVELYLDWLAGDPAAGLLELEVHAPMRRLAPGEAMQARETWTVLPYDGPDAIDAQRARLASVLRDLGVLAD